MADKSRNAQSLLEPAKRGVCLSEPPYTPSGEAEKPQQPPRSTRREPAAQTQGSKQPWIHVTSEHKRHQ